MIRSGDTAVVTGAAKGIGKGIATALAREGVKVYCLDKD
ncbi:MAG: SDR family NAD(P)-dependent oxidoreductase, partial [Erysipelotrichaceae bacterium]|nr:SDR family NAD(P)-dependent oxidoreductase [Erysipelotrichaceae bacterium]